MTDEEAIFDEALGKGSASERSTYLDDACAGNAGLRRGVEALLLAHQRAVGILEAPLAGLAGAGVSHLSSEGVGSTVGPYKLLEQIGGGGMGVVYMAEQLRPVRRKVALKIIKPGMDSGQVIARFEAERQALTMMDHPNIAKVLDAGTTDAGRPYFVMELVKGIAITDYCDQARLATRERLELFIQVCHAVQHAHQKGVIHRDLKPGNVLVTLHDDKPVPKVIDFGIAKAAGQVLTERTLFTNYAQMLGTPLYMSPEQAQLSGLDVDTRSDVYSLGVLLYELLTGTTPFDKQRLRDAACDEMRRIIREEDPPNPSTRLSTMGEKLTTISAYRHTEPKKLGQVMRGELDWIVMKSLEKDRTRRYETASGLAMDLQRHLADEPVLACPPDARYRLGKFFRRYRSVLTTVAAFGLILIIGAVVSTWQAVRATRAQRIAIASAQAERGAREAEADQRRQAQEISGYMISALSSPSPWRDGHTITIAEVLDRNAKELQDKFADSPLTKAALLEAIGQAYMGLGLYRESIPLFEQARQLKQTTLSAEHPDVLHSMHSLAVAYHYGGRMDEGVQLIEATFRLRRATLGPDHPDTLHSMHSLAIAYWGVNRKQDAVLLFEDTLRIRKAKLGLDHRDTFLSADGLGTLYSEVGRSNEAVSLLQETLKLMQAKLGPEMIDTLWVMDHLATAYRDAGRPAEALILDEKVLPLRQSKLGPDHPNTLGSMHKLALDYRAMERLSEAVTLMEEALKLSRVKPGLDDIGTLWLLNDLASAYQAAGRGNDAVSVLEEAVALNKASYGPDHTQTLGSEARLRGVQAMLNQPPPATTPATQR